MKTLSFIHSRNWFLVLVILLSGFLFSCKKFVDIDPPVNQLTTNAVFSNDEAAEAALRGLYSEITQTINTIGNGALSLYSGLSADEIIRTSASTTYDPFTTNSLIATDLRIYANYWQRAYYHIYHANAILENLSHSINISSNLKKQIRGEAIFFRAFFHFYLTNLFGAIPLIITSDYRINGTIIRSDTPAVYSQIIADLTEAKQLLLTTYPTADRARINHWAASALLSRVYLYKKDWVNAENEATRVIGASVYQLNNLNSVFLPNSSETILQLMPPITLPINSSEGFAFVPSSTTVIPSFILTNYLLNEFEPGDQRKAMWVKSNTVATIVYNYPYKYKVRQGTAGAAKSEYNVVLRLGEQYLIRAEARIQLNNIAGAQSDLNIIRNRASLPNVTANTQQGLLTAIEHERQIELFAEWGHRWLDLKRTGRADAILGTRKSPNWQSTDALYPIPKTEIETNLSLTQNPGY